MPRLRLIITIESDVHGDPIGVEDAVDLMLDSGELQDAIEDAAREQDVEGMIFLSSSCTVEAIEEQTPPESTPGSPIKKSPQAVLDKLLGEYIGQIDEGAGR